MWKVHCRGVHISANIKIEIQQSEETSQAALVNFHVHQLVSLAYITLVGSPDPFHILLLKCEAKATNPSFLVYSRCGESGKGQKPEQLDYRKLCGSFHITP